MILEQLGILSTAQALTGASSTDSENVIQVAAIDFSNLTDLWWVVDTVVIAAGDGSDTFDFILYMSQESTLDTNIELVSVGFTGIADIRVATIGRHIAAFNIGDQLMQYLGTLQTSGTDYIYLGMISTLSAGATLTINASLSPSRPPTEFDTQVTVSNVGVPT